MGVLASRLDPSSDAYRANRAANLELLAELDRLLAQARAGGGQKYVDRHRARGKLLARERVELLLDRDGPFLELSPLAAWGTDFPVGASGVTGVGPVAGVECVVTASDPTVRGGATNPLGLRKTLRAMEIAERNRLPLVQLIESSGADLPTQSQIFIPGGAVFRNLTRLSRAGIPTVALVFGTPPPAGPTSRACPTTPSWSGSGPRCSSAGRRWSRWPPASRPATRSWAGPRCTPAPPAWPTSWPPTSTTASGSAARSSPTWAGASSAPARPGPPTSPCTTPRSCSAWPRSTSRSPPTCARSWPGWSTAPGSRSGSRCTAPACAAAGRRSTATRSGSWPTPAGCCSPRSPTRRPTSSSSPTSPRRRCCSSRTPPATWSARPTSSGGSSRTGPR